MRRCRRLASAPFAARLVLEYAIFITKKKIFVLIEDGVRSFDPQLVTYLTSDSYQVGFYNRMFVLVMQLPLSVVLVVGG